MARNLHSNVRPVVTAKPVDSTSGETTDNAHIIVGIGASAGGLEAFKAFLKAMPNDSGIAFVLDSHLDPAHESQLASILQGSTSMPVCTAEQGERLTANSVYVLPPNREIRLLDGRLQLTSPSFPHGQRMPIDIFLRSLAEEQGRYAVGIILSGTGMDGTKGLEAIRNAGGVCLVQDPKSALYSGMPASAIEADTMAQVLMVEDMPEFLLSLSQRWADNVMVLPQPGHTLKDAELRPILHYLHVRTGHDFSQYKHNTIARRVQRRMQLQGIEDVQTYARFLQDNHKEIQILFKELLINVTAFFRDPQAFNILKTTLLPDLYKDRAEGDTFRVWVAGGSTGEEAYSIAMVLHEFLSERNLPLNVQIYSTDISDEVTAFARAGCYPLSISETVSEQRLKQFFIRENSGYRIARAIRQKVVFAKQDLTRDPPFTRLDLLSCRNVLIYLEARVQESLFPLFHYALKPEGILFLSPSESVGKQTELFTAVDRTWKFYRTTRNLMTTHSLQHIALLCAKPGTRQDEHAVTQSIRPNLPEIARRALLASFAPASVLTDKTGNILYVHGDIGDFLRPAPGEATLNVVDMAINELQEPLQTALRSVAKSAVAYTRELTLKCEEKLRSINLIVRHLAHPESGNNLLLISFQSVTMPSATETQQKRPAVRLEEVSRIEALEHQLAYTRENLQAIIEDHQAANEELQSMNEELQSTNEELETSKEELQSINEELTTVNAEHQSKIDELLEMQNDMKNLLDNVSVGTIFLDINLMIRRFSREATQLYHFVASDEGRPFEDINSKIKDVNIIEQARAVLTSLIPWESEVTTNTGAGYLVRIVPYRTLANVIDGVVITFTNITQRITEENVLRESRELAQNIIDTVREPMLVLDNRFHIVSASRAYYELFGTQAEKLLAHSLFSVEEKQWDVPELRKALENLRDNDDSFNKLNLRLRTGTAQQCEIVLNARRLLRRESKALLILMTMEPKG